jgi:ubiquinone/menaquinone biosynthesis C-methylase UbiE
MYHALRITYYVLRVEYCVAMSTLDSASSTYDRGMLLLERLIFRRLRRRIFPRLGGDVLELGVGTGVNLPLYGSGARVTGCDANGEMLAWAARRHARATAALVQADAQRLPFADGSFDVVAASLVFCSVADPGRALAEARRVLHRPAPTCPDRGRGAEGRCPELACPERGRRTEGRPGGRLVLLEHTRGNGLGAWLTDVLHPLWDTWSRECRLNRETTRTVAAAGFQVQRVEHHALGIVQVIEATV